MGVGADDGGLQVFVHLSDAPYVGVVTEDVVVGFVPEGEDGGGVGWEFAEGGEVD